MSVSALELKVFQGLVRAAPLTVTLPAESQGSFKGELSLEKINLDLASKALSARSKKAVGGRLNAKLTLQGEGSTWEALSPTLQGEGSMQLNKGILYGLDPEAAIMNELSKKVPGVQRRRPRPLKLKTLSSEVEVKGGALHMREPVAIETSEGPMKINGSLGFNLNTDLSATLSLDPKRLSKQLGRPVPQKSPIKVPFKVSGPLSDPKVSGVGLAALVGVAALGLGGPEALKAAERLKQTGAEALQKGQREAKRALKRANREVKRALKRETARAAAKAEEAKRAAETQAKREVERAKREAQKKAEEAKKKAQKAKKDAQKKAKKAQKAAEKLKGLF